MSRETEPEGGSPRDLKGAITAPVANLVRRGLTYYGPLTDWKLRAYRNAGSMGVGQVVSLFLLFLLNITIARFLGKEQFGVYALATNLIFLLLVPASFGLVGLGSFGVRLGPPFSPRSWQRQACSTWFTRSRPVHTRRKPPSSFSPFFPS